MNTMVEAFRYLRDVMRTSPCRLHRRRGSPVDDAEDYGANNATVMAVAWKAMDMIFGKARPEVGTTGSSLDVLARSASAVAWGHPDSPTIGKRRSSIRWATISAASDVSKTVIKRHHLRILAIHVNRLSLPSGSFC